jgi:hypothetical protein
MHYGHCIHILWSLYTYTMVIVYIYYGHCIHILWSLYTYTMVVVYIYFWLFVVDFLPGMAALLQLQSGKVWINYGF